MFSLDVQRVNSQTLKGWNMLIKRHACYGKCDCSQLAAATLANVDKRLWFGRRIAPFQVAPYNIRKVHFVEAALDVTNILPSRGFEHSGILIAFPHVADPNGKRWDAKLVCENHLWACHKTANMHARTLSTFILG
jgi:hypothetical protein